MSYLRNRADFYKFYNGSKKHSGLRPVARQGAERGRKASRWEKDFPEGAKHTKMHYGNSNF